MVFIIIGLTLPLFLSKIIGARQIWAIFNRRQSRTNSLPVLGSYLMPMLDGGIMMNVSWWGLITWVIGSLRDLLLDIGLGGLYNGLLGECVVWWIHVLMDVWIWIVRRMRLMYHWICGWMDGWIVGWMWMNGWIDWFFESIAEFIVWWTIGWIVSCMDIGWSSSKRWQLFDNVMAVLDSYAWWLADGFGWWLWLYTVAVAWRL